MITIKNVYIIAGGNTSEIYDLIANIMDTSVGIFYFIVFANDKRIKRKLKSVFWKNNSDYPQFLIINN